jgi:hypothetical protein
MDLIQSKRTFGDMGEQHLLHVTPAKLSAAERKRLDNPVAVSFRILWVSKVVHKLKTMNAMEPTRFLKFEQWEPALKDTSVSAIEFCSRTNRSSSVHFRISEMKQARPANFRSFNFNHNS